jgi:hypothetical protein
MARGTDWRLSRAHAGGALRAQTTARKAAVLARTPALLALLGGGGGGADAGADADVDAAAAAAAAAGVCVDAQAGVVAAPRYALRPADLREPAQVAAALAAAGADLRHARAAPTPRRLPHSR